MASSEASSSRSQKEEQPFNSVVPNFNSNPTSTSEFDSNFNSNSALPPLNPHQYQASQQVGRETDKPSLPSSPPSLPLPPPEFNHNHHHNHPHEMIANSNEDFKHFDMSYDDEEMLDGKHLSYPPQPHLQKSSHSASSSQDSNSTYNQSPFSYLETPLQAVNLPFDFPFQDSNNSNQHHFNSFQPSLTASGNPNQNGTLANHLDFSNHHDFPINLSPNSLAHSELHSDITNLNEWSSKHLGQLNQDSMGADGMPMGIQGGNVFEDYSTLGLGHLTNNSNPIGEGTNEDMMSTNDHHQFDPSNLPNSNLYQSPLSNGNGFFSSPSFRNSELGNFRSPYFVRQKSDEGVGSGESGGSEPEEKSSKTGSNKRLKVRKGTEQVSAARQRLALTCDPCREKHLKCDLKSLKDSNGEDVACSRCSSRGIECSKKYSPPSRLPRPSRSGKRIEQARLIHGAVSGSSGPSASPSILALQLTRADNRISSHIMGGSLSLKLLACFFATAHQQMPCVDFTLFATRFNAAQGDPRIMSIMANGGDEAQGIEALIAYTPGVKLSSSNDIRDSTISTPGSSEALIAAMQAWAAHYTDAPIAFGTQAKELGIGGNGTKRIVDIMEDGEKIKKTSSSRPTIFSSVKVSDPNATATLNAKGVRRRPKRKQGVACDACKIRRIRCSLFDPGRPEGSGCSQCETKGIVCTDVYIQSKKKEKEEKAVVGKGKSSAKEEEAGSSSLSTSNQDSSTSNAPGVGPNSWKGQALEMKAWADAGPQAPFKNGGGNGKDMLKWGKAREPFCHDLLARAIALVEKHDLLRKPSVEAIQTLLILISIIDFTDKDFGRKLSTAAARHQITLQLRARFEVDERDQKAVETFLSEMQHTRVYLSMWTRDAIASGMYRVRPTLVDDRAVEVNRGKLDPEDLSSSTSSADAPARTSRDESSGIHLSGEMGLTFSIMALIQIGALSRFIAKHIDVVYDADSGSAEMDPAQRFPPNLTSNQLRKIEKACNAVWQSIDALMLFFDRCTAKAKEDLDRLGKLAPFQPLNWIAGIKICGSMLHLAMYRVVGERMRVNANYLSHLSQAHARGEIQNGPSREQLDQAKALRELFETSRERSLTSCRRAARLIAFLLPRRIFHTSGVLLRQLFPVAQFLARSPSVQSKNLDQSFSNLFSSSNQIPNPPFISSSTSNAGIDPTRLSTSPTLSTNTNLPESDQHHSSEGVGQTHIPLNATMAELGPFDEEAKKLEVGWVIQGLEQIGYAWSDVDKQIESVQSILEISR